MRSFIEKPCALSLAYLCLVLCISSGVQGIWFGRPGDSWMRSKVIWQRPQNEETDQVTVDRGRYPPPRDDVQDALYSWSAEEEDDKRDGVSSKILFKLIRGKGRSSTTKRSAECQTDEFRCDDGSCIPNELVCDGQQNCQLGSDELVGLCKVPRGIEVPPKHDSTPGSDVGNRQHDRMNEECLHTLINGLRIAGPFTRSYNCPVGYMKCALQRQCYDERYACDGYIDCLDGSDEAECATTPCPAEGYIKCDNQWQCFDANRRCDGQVDCNDGSDERNCASTPCSGSGQVKCADKKQCYRAVYTCDAVIDCSDGSDERNCSTFQCLPGFKKCANNQQCYNESHHCDGIVHCVDGSDELSCHSNAEKNASSLSDWQCKHEVCGDGTKCYLWHLRCDGIPACDDGSDELGCASSSCPPRKVKCEDRQQCIWEEWLCDGEVQCKDGSEERGCTVYVPQFDQGLISDVTDALNVSTEATSQTPQGELSQPNA